MKNNAQATLLHWYRQTAEPILAWSGMLLRRPTAWRWYQPWKASLGKSVTALQAGQPWLTYGALDWLERFLTSQMTIFEWGSGGSTVYLVKRVAKLVSIEHDPNWYKSVKAALPRSSRTLVDYQLYQPERVHHASDALPKNNYPSADPRFSGYQFRQYVQAIDQFPDSTFDLVIVDGRARVACMKHARTKVKIGGAILLDNADRVEYQAGYAGYDNFERHDFFGPGPYNLGFWQTSVFCRQS